MCEICVVDPEKCGLPIIHQLAYEFYEEQGDGLGVLAVKNRGDKFEYSHYKSTKPHWQTLYGFLRRNIDDTYRFVVHGRNGTAGGVNREAAHPIEVNCQHCEFDWVIHNGSVRHHENHISSLESQGHAFTTEVDTEVIPHKVSELPGDVEDLGYDAFGFYGNLNYLLFSSDGVFVRTTNKYDLSEEFTMTCRYRDFDDPEDLGFDTGRNNKWMLVLPGEDPEIKIEESGVYYSDKAQRGYNRSTTACSTTRTTTTTTASPAEESYTVTYTDLVPDLDFVSAFYVTPDVIRVVDENTGENDYIKRSREPRLFYWYSGEEPSRDIEELEEKAEIRQQAMKDVATGDYPGEQTTLDDYVIDAVSQAAALAVAKRMGEMDLDDITEIQAEVEKTVREVRESTLEATA